MRIAIITGLPSFEPYYSVARCVRDQTAMLQSGGHDVTVYVKVGFVADFGTLPCISKVRTPGFMKVEGRTIETIAKEFDATFGQGELAGYDLCITHDFMFLPSLIGYREGVKLVAAKIKAKWMHWSHSVPQKSLGEGSEAIPGHVYVALAHEHIEGVARMYGCSAELVPVVWNPSDILDTIDSRARLIADQLDLLDCDILGVLPFSIGRIDQKGIHHALQLYAALSKKRRVKVLLCNSLSGTEEAQKNVEMWDRRMKEQVDAVGPGDLSWWWMSRVMEQWDRWTPNEVIRDLQRLSNVFIYPTIGEGFSLAIGEALAAGPLCILPQEGVRGMRELEALGGVLLLRLRNKPWREEKDIRPREELAAEIEPHLEPHVSRLRRQYALSRGGIWKRMLEPAISKHVRE